MTRLAIALALGLLLAVGAWWWWGAAAPDLPVPERPVPTAPAPAGGTAEPARSEPATRVEPGPDDEAAPPPDRTPLAPTATTPQGLRGLVLDEAAQPLAGVQVHLLDSAGNDPLALPLLLQQRLPASALATTATQRDGTFAIGLPRVQARVYELHLVSPRHATVRIGELRLLPGEWHDLGAITLGPGATLRGRVTVEGLSTPVPNAVITIEAGTAFDDVARRSLPAGHHGLVATTDASGRYELLHAPGRGVVRVSAAATGFARVVRQDVELTTAQPIELDFALPPGWTLRGLVLDADGRPCDEVRIEAWPMQAAAAATVTTSDHTGSFAVQGLQAGKYRLRAIARGWQTGELTDVEAGRQDLQFRLARRGRIEVRATTPEGTVLRNYQLGVRRYFADRGGQIGFVADVPEQGVRLDGMTDYGEVDGLPAGTFVCEVVAAGYAKTLSAPFTVGAEPPAAATRIDVVVSRGATLRGVVLLEDGTPLAGAEVASQADGADPDHPAWKLLAGNVPDRITAVRTTTAADGSFALPHLTFGDYQLAVQHPEACPTMVRQIRVDRVAEILVPTIRMVRGALVMGHATFGGRVAGQIKVVLAEAGSGRQGPMTRLETVTDAQGVFRMPRRVPPGTYELRAAVVGTAEPDTQILAQLLQLKRSSTTVSVPIGTAVVERDIDIPDDR